jgi:hypothetical protein
MRAKHVVCGCAAALTGLLAHADLMINEVCYNNSAVADETGDTSSDWIELYNPGPSAVNINGYRLGDQSPFVDDGHGVVLPNYTVPAGGFLVVFAGGDTDRTVWTNAPNVSLISSNSTWRYDVSATVPTALWKTNTFNDVVWTNGLSPLGYNDANASLDCATVLEYGGVPSSRYITTYFRNSFRVINPSVVTGLQMNARINDGAVVYLNGREIWRYNMPGGAITNTTLASQALSPTLWTSAVLATNGLILGTNVVAVEVHQASASSSEMVMDMSLTALVNVQVPIVHGNFGLKSDFSENVHLWNASGTKLQKFEPPSGSVLPGENQTYGADPDGSTTSFRVYASPTPGAANDQTPSAMLTNMAPSFAVAPGAYSGSQNVTLTSTAGYKICYSTDGSDPRAASSYVYSSGSVTVGALAAETSGLAWLRTNPVEITNNVPNAGWQVPSGSVTRAVTLRAVTVSSDGKYCSPEACGTYFIGSIFTNRTLPVVSIIANTDDLFGFVSGLFVPGKCYADSAKGYGSNKWGKPYANYHQDNVDEVWERPVHFELIETNRTTPSVTQRLGLAMYGGGSRALPQKTLYLMARETEYGTGIVNYALFPDETATSYKRFLLRNSGNDWYGPNTSGVATMMKDAVFERIIKGLNLSVMAYRPAVVYINGEYWGLHNLRESYDKNYLATRYGIDADSADILMHAEDPDESGNVVITRVDGSKSADDDYEAMLDWVETNTLSAAAFYQQLQQKIDVANYTDYIVAETFFGNTDWPLNNCDFWRTHTNEVAACGVYGDTRWRWMLYDLDLSGTEGANYNMFAYLKDNSMTGRHEPGYLINTLWGLTDYQTNFVARYANLLNTTFRPERTAKIVTQAAAAIASEMETHYRRWGRPYTQTQWRLAVTNEILDYSASRYAVSWSHLNASFTLGGVGDLTVRNNSTNGLGGHFSVNGITIETTTDGVTNRAQWSGRFFRSLAVPVLAVPDAGYVFDGWVGTTLTNAARTLFVEVSPKTVVARFRLAAAAAHVASGYEQWQMANYSEQEILGGVAAEPDAVAGFARMSNFELYAFGMSRSDGLTDDQRRARASLSINNRSNALWVGYTRLNGGFTDVQYTLKTALALNAPVTWSNAVTGVDFDDVATTNVLDASTWFYERRLPAASPLRDARFFKLEASRP